MTTIFKITFTNVMKKKFRSILIVLSILLSVGLIYSVLSLSVSATKIFEHLIKKQLGNVEIMILPKENSGEQLMPALDFNQLEGISYHVPVMMAYGFSKINEETVPIAFTGMSEQEYKTIYGLDFVQEKSDELSGNQVYIGEETAQNYKLSQKDKLKVSIAGTEYDFTIAGIIEDRMNSLCYEAGQLKLMVSPDTLNKIGKADGQVAGYYIKSTDQFGKTALIKELKKAFPEKNIKDVSDLSEYKQYINMIMTSLLLMTMAVIMVSAFIIFTSFKMISIERMPLMGTLRSIGATKKMTVRTMLLEAMFYGLSGGILGDALGISILFATIKIMLKMFHISIDNVSYINVGYLVASLIIGVSLAVGSALIPVIKMSNKSIRSIIFSEIQNEKHTSLYKTLLGAVMIAAAFVLFQTAPVKLRLTLDILGALMVCIGGAFIIPMLSRLLLKIVSILLKPFGRSGFEIVSGNINHDRNMMNNIMLLAMGLGVIFMINNFSTAVGTAVTDVYAKGKMDAQADGGNFDDDFISKVNKVDGVEHTYFTKNAPNISANDGSIKLMYVIGIDGGDYCDYAFDEFGKYMTDDLVRQLKNERSILITRFTAKKYDLSVGDILKIDFNHKKVNYKVAGIVPSVINNGNMNFVYEKYLTEDAGIKNYQSMYVNIRDNADTKQVLEHIRELLPNQILPIQTLKEMQDQNVKSNNIIFYMMKAISIIAMFIGIIGIFNNFMICFISRRKLYASMRSLGLSKSRTVINMLSEAFCCGLLGTISGMLLGTVLFKAMCYVIEAMGITSEIAFYSIKDYIFVLASGIIISLISAIFPALRISGENIVSGLKYE